MVFVIGDVDENKSRCYLLKHSVYLTSVCCYICITFTFALWHPAESSL